MMAVSGLRPLGQVFKPMRCWYMIERELCKRKKHTVEDGMASIQAEFVL